MTILIVDGNNMAHRARHAFKLSNKGVDVSVTYGMLRMIMTLCDKFKPSSILVCWDGGVPEFRCKAVPEYKSNRNHGDPLEYEDFLRQVNELRDYAFPMMGIINVVKSGAEADDLMYHACKVLKGIFMIVTSDKDLFQAISPTTMVYNPAREKVYTIANFEDEIGIGKDNYVDWRAIQGDSSDNIPGVNGIGEKTATKLFKELGCLTNITNAALGCYPDKQKAARVLSPKIAASICAFGFDNIVKNIYITALYADRVGARLAVADAVAAFQPANPQRIRNYLLRNAFVSVLESMGYFSKLVAPELAVEYVRMPVIYSTRRMPA